LRYGLLEGIIIDVSNFVTIPLDVVFRRPLVGANVHELPVVDINGLLCD
jgi:hypothetical protein